MLVYLCVFATAVGLAWLASHGRAGAEVVLQPRPWTGTALAVIAVLAGVSALRWRVGTDYWTYERLLPAYADAVEGGVGPFDEPGFLAIAWFAERATGDSATLFAVCAVVTVALIVGTLWKWSPAFAFAVAIYLASGAWHESFNAVRQYLACAVLFAGHRHIIERRFWAWAIIVVLASLFHVSAALTLLLYFVPVRRSSALFQMGVVAIGVIALLASDSVIQLLGELTGDDHSGPDAYAQREIHPLRIGFAFVPIVLSWLLRNSEAVKQGNAYFYVNMLAVYAATYVAAADSAYLARYAIYALPFVAIGLAFATSVASTRERALIRTVVVAVYCSFAYIEISGIPNLSNFQWLFDRAG